MEKASPITAVVFVVAVTVVAGGFHPGGGIYWAGSQVVDFGTYVCARTSNWSATIVFPVSVEEKWNVNTYTVS